MDPAPHPAARATVIVATYENPGALAMSLAGLARQSTDAFEIVVADDGSGPATGHVVDTFAGRSTVRVRRVWQEDRGVRKGRILNRALLAAEHDYVIFLDGDVVPSPDFVALHLALARPGTYLSGSCVLLGPRASGRLTPDAVARGALDGLRSLRPGNRRSRRLLVRRLAPVATVLDECASRRPVGFHGGNASVARPDALAIGGFDERLERLEDKDFGHRLRLWGLRGRSVRHRILAWHLHHPRPYAGSDVRARSRSLYAENVARGAARTTHGLRGRDGALDVGTRSA